MSISNPAAFELSLVKKLKRVMLLHVSALQAKLRVRTYTFMSQTEIPL